MIDLPLPSSKSLASLSPTSFEGLRLCRLRTAFGQLPKTQLSPRTSQQVLGDLCHAVLEELVISGSILRDDWREAVDPLWLILAARMADAVHATPHEPSLSGPPDLWPGYVIKRARLNKTAGRLHDLLAAAGEDAELVCEKPLATADGRLQGRPDLIVRAAADSWVVDFKSGAVIDAERHAPRASYVRQLHFYALLDEAVTGRWPSQAFLVPLNGPVVEVLIDQVEATELGDQARQAIAAFNSAAPGHQPAAPSPEACGYCPWTTSCPAFWQACDATWEGTMAAVAGVVRRAAQAEIGGVSLTLEVEVGSVGEQVIAVRNVSPTEHPVAVQITAGDEIALVGLRKLHHSDEFALPAWGRLAVWARTS